MLTGYPLVNVVQIRTAAPASAAGVTATVRPSQESPRSSAPTPLCETRLHVIRTVSLRDISAVTTAPARATASHRFGCAEPNSANTVVKITGSGFQLEPPAM